MFDTAVLVGRCLRLSRRSIDALLTSLMLPVMIMLLFVYLFGGAIRTDMPQYVTYVVPGVLALCAAFGAASSAVPVNQDLDTAMVDRFRSMDVGGVALLSGHVAASVARNVASTALVLGVAVLIGFRPQAGVTGWSAALGLVLLFVFALSWLAAAFGALVRSAEAANALSFVIMFLTYPSSAFVPIATMPSWMQGFARHQPVTPFVESLRALMLDRPAGSGPLVAVLWLTGLGLASMMASAALFRRRIR